MPSSARLGGWFPWWALIPFFSCGLATFAVVLVAGVRMNDRRTQLFAAGYFAVLALYCMSVPFTSPDEPGVVASAFAGVHALVNWWLGSVHVLLLQLRTKPAANPAPPPALTTDPAVAAALWRLTRRQEARAILASNPPLAAELKIGRPDLPRRTYDDGGLVDVNHVPAAVLAAELELPVGTTEQIVAERDRLGGFSSPEELLVYATGLTQQRMESLRDRLVFLPM